MPQPSPARPQASKRPPSPARPRPQARSKRPPLVWIGLGLVVVGAAIVAFVGTRDTGSDDNSGLQQQQPVEVTGAALAPIPDSGADPAIGQIAPELHGKSFDGSAVDVAHDGRPKLLVFVAHWCPHCQREVPLIVDHLASNPLPADIDLVAIATSTSADQPNYPPSDWLEQEGWPAPVLADSPDYTAANAYGLQAFPYFVALDADGKVVARTTGEISTDDFDALVNQALGTQ